MRRFIPRLNSWGFSSTLYNRLDSLAEDGVLQTKKVGANSRVWWWPAQKRGDQGEVNPNGEDQYLDEAIPDCEPSVPGSGGEMAERIREFEWAETPLGPMAEWPQELRTAVDIMLGADEAIGIDWGDDLVLLYDDGVRDLSIAFLLGLGVVALAQTGYLVTGAREGTLFAAVGLSG